MKVKSYFLLLLVLTISVTFAISAEPPEPKPFIEVLNESQALYMQWTEEQFANFLDKSEFSNLRKQN
jgi:hypothetical protein